MGEYYGYTWDPRSVRVAEHDTYVPEGRVHALNATDFSDADRVAHIRVLWPMVQGLDPAKIADLAQSWRTLSSQLATAKAGVDRAGGRLAPQWTGRASRAFLERVGAALYSLDHWIEAAAANAATIDRLAEDVRTTQPRVEGIYRAWLMESAREKAKRDKDAEGITLTQDANDLIGLLSKDNTIADGGALYRWARDSVPQDEIDRKYTAQALPLVKKLADHFSGAATAGVSLPGRFKGPTTFKFVQPTFDGATPGLPPARPVSPVVSAVPPVVAAPAAPAPVTPRVPTPPAVPLVPPQVPGVRPPGLPGAVAPVARQSAPPAPARTAAPRPALPALPGRTAPRVARPAPPLPPGQGRRGTAPTAPVLPGRTSKPGTPNGGRSVPALGTGGRPNSAGRARPGLEGRTNRPALPASPRTVAPPRLAGRAVPTGRNSPRSGPAGHGAPGFGPADRHAPGVGPADRGAPAFGPSDRGAERVSPGHPYASRGGAADRGARLFDAADRGGPGVGSRDRGWDRVDAVDRGGPLVGPGLGSEPPEFRRGAAPAPDDVAGPARPPRPASLGGRRARPLPSAAPAASAEAARRELSGRAAPNGVQRPDTRPAVETRRAPDAATASAEAFAPTGSARPVIERPDVPVAQPAGPALGRS